MFLELWSHHWSQKIKKTTIRTHTHKVLDYRCYTFRKLLKCFFCIYRKFSSSSQSNRFQQNICQFQLIPSLMWIYRNNIIEHNIKCTSIIHIWHWGPLIQWFLYNRYTIIDVIILSPFFNLVLVIRNESKSNSIFQRYNQGNQKYLFE